MRSDFRETQKDYSLYLPAISSFYAAYIGRQRYEEYIPADRIPIRFTNGVEGLNFLNMDEGYFKYPWALYSAGHANIDLNKHDPKEDMVRNRDNANTILLGDSGGFQISKGVWEGKWLEPYGVDEKTDKTREKVLHFLEGTFDYSMVLDLPTMGVDWAAGTKHGLDTWQKCLQGTINNNDFFAQARTPGATKFLNVLQGNNWDQAEKWYEAVKPYSTGEKANFECFAMAGWNKKDIEIALKRFVTLRRDGLLQDCEWIHFLGTGELLWSVMLTALQRTVRDTTSPGITLSYDCASPFLASAYGTIYTSIHTDHLRKGGWTYRMIKAIDDKKYSTDSRIYDYNIEHPGVAWEPSVITEMIEMKDVCPYGPGDLNKIGKEGKTSWDSFSYALQMAHNVYMHILATQRANECYDQGIYPPSLVAPNGATISDVITDIFAHKDYNNAMAEIHKYSKWFARIQGEFKADAMADEFGIEPMGKVEEEKKEKYSANKAFNELFD